MSLVLALSPILLIFVFLFLARWSALKTGGVVLIYTIGLTGLYPAFPFSWLRLQDALIQGGLTTFIAAYVLFFGIFLFHLMKKTDQIEHIARFIQQQTSDPLKQSLILVLGLSPLIESTSGFGVAFFVIAPILLELGFPPFRAAVIGLVSLLAVPWGALATGTVIGAQLSDLSLHDLGWGSAVLSIPVVGYFVLIGVREATSTSTVYHRIGVIVAAILLFNTTNVLVNAYISVELAGVFSSLFLLSAGFLLLGTKTSMHSSPFHAATIQPEASASHRLYLALSPYVFLTVTIFLTRLLTPIQQWMENYWVWRLPAYSFELSFMYSPGFWLFLTCVFTITILRIRPSIVRASLQDTWKQWFPFVCTTFFLVAISQVMTVSHMIADITAFAAMVLGPLFLLLSPVIGGFGGFLTGSNTGSNAMFMNMQVQTGERLGISSSLLAVIQNTSSSHTTMAFPSRIQLAASICGIPDKENQLFRRMLLLVSGSILILLLSILVYTFVRMILG